MLIESGKTFDRSEINVPIEEILSSKGRIKIMRMLLRRGELNISEIVKLTKLNHNSVVQHLELLKRAGFVDEKNFGRIRIYSVRNESLLVKAMRSFVSLWGPPRTEINK
ncbi:MAG: ArsR family transcriptional regulator [Promethearchaeati archaeon SRVP18_Atabeyarchaeia-1]